MIIGLTGFAQSGKDTAASFLVERGFKRLAFADILRQSLYNLNPIVAVGMKRSTPFDLDDPTVLDHLTIKSGRVQDIVDSIGWDVAKVKFPEVRELLQRMGTEVGRELYGENFWVDMAMKQIKYNTIAHKEVGDYVITDVRFPNEEAAVHRAGGRLFRIERPGTGAVNPHASEQYVLRMPVDGVIFNDGDLNQYRVNVLEAVGLD